MPKKKASSKRRSGCPLNASVEILGDRWSLLIIRDMMLRGFRSYKEFLESYERIATNILADRLQKLIAHGIITKARDQTDLLAHAEGDRSRTRPHGNGALGSRVRRY